MGWTMTNSELNDKAARLEWITQRDAHRFWAKVDRSGDCWIWHGAVKDDGYGAFEMHPKTWRAHRFAYTMCVDPIPRGKMVLHKCDNPLCVRPSHLYAGTAADNARDRGERGRTARGANGPNAKYCQEMIDTMRRLRQWGLPYKDLDQMFGVGKGYSFVICCGKVWDPTVEAAVKAMEVRG